MSNLGQYIPDVRLYAGDTTGTEFSDSLILEALENAIPYLARRWDSKYVIFSSGIVSGNNGIFYTVNVPQGSQQIAVTTLEGDVFRNAYVTFTSTPPPIIQSDDLPAILIAASYLLRRSKAASTTAGVVWSTPDLSYSNVQSSKMYQELMKWDLEALELFFKQRLGRIQLGRFVGQYEVITEADPWRIANWYYRLAQGNFKG
jgi:hypothetical protein